MVLTPHNIPIELLPPNYRSAVVTAPLELEYLTRNGQPHHYVVPSGFETDFASVPRFFWRILPPWGPWTPAAVMHDHLYATQPPSLGETDGARRAEADRRFLGAMKVSGVSWAQRTAMYYGVRSGGWVAWRGHQKRKLTQTEES